MKIRIVLLLLTVILVDTGGSVRAHQTEQEAPDNGAKLHFYPGHDYRPALLAQSSIELAQVTKDDSAPDVARGLNNLANMYRNADKDEQAEPVVKNSGVTRKRAPRPNAPDISNRIKNLGGLYGDTDRENESKSD